MSLAFSQNSLIPIINLVLLLTFSLIAWQRRQVLANRLFAWLGFLMFAATVPVLIQTMTQDPSIIVAMEKLSAIPWNIITPLSYVFVCAYVGSPLRITPRSLALLGVIPLLYLLLLLTNDLHGLVYSRLDVHYESGRAVIDYVFNTNSPVVIIGYGHVFAIAAAMCWEVYRALRRGDTAARGQAWLLIASVVTLMFTIVLDLAGVLKQISPYAASLSVTLTCLPIVFSFFRYHFLDLAPHGYSLAVQSMPDSVFIIDDQQRLVEVNPAAEELMNRARADIVGKNLREVFPQYWQQVYTRLERETAHEVITVGEGEDVVAYDVRVSPLPRRGGRKTGVVAVVRDVTELKRTERELVEYARQRERAGMLRTFLTDVAHDVRTPLAVLNTSTHVLRRQGEMLAQDVSNLRGTHGDYARQTVDKLAERIGIMDGKTTQVVANAKRLQTLLDAMFEMVRLDNVDQFDFAPTDLNRLIVTTLDPQQAHAAQKEIRLAFEGAEGLPPVRLNGVYFSRAIQNLVENALRYTPNGGSVTVRTSCDERYIVVSIIDSGIGIAAEDLPHVFDRFYRSDKARDTETGGMGLGLSIVQKVVSAHGGDIKVDSSAGAGATFRILLPLEISVSTNEHLTPNPSATQAGRRA
jgi:PAS domain S-box-containing protein